MMSRACRSHSAIGAARTVTHRRRSRYCINNLDPSLSPIKCNWLIELHVAYATLTCHVTYFVQWRSFSLDRESHETVQTALAAACFGVSLAPHDR